MWNEKDPSAIEDPAAGGGLYGDSETRAFYEELPDLLTLVPLNVLGFTPEQVQNVFFQQKEEHLSNFLLVFT